MGLSSDPEKAQRQLAGLEQGRQVLARKVLGLGDDAPPAKAPAKAKPKQTADPDRLTITDPPEEHAPPPAPGPEPERPARGGGFLDGLLGRI